MAGMPRGGSDVAQQATDPITPTIHNDDNTSRSSTAYNKAMQSASNMREKIAGTFQPGDNKATTRRRSDVPPGANLQQREQAGEEGEEENSSLLQSAQETVSKALGGGGGGRGSRA